MDQEVTDFFLRYERANRSIDVTAIGHLYADTFTFAGPNGVQVARKEDFLKIVPKRKAYFAAMGLSETRLLNSKADALDRKYLLASVTWRMTIGKAAEGKHIDASASYLLMRGQADALSILFQIDHQDLAILLQSQYTAQQ